MFGRIFYRKKGAGLLDVLDYHVSGLLDSAVPFFFFFIKLILISYFYAQFFFVNSFFQILFQSLKAYTLCFLNEKKCNRFNTTIPIF